MPSTPAPCTSLLTKKSINGYRNRYDDKYSPCLIPMLQLKKSWHDLTQ